VKLIATFEVQLNCNLLVERKADEPLPSFHAEVEGLEVSVQLLGDVHRIIQGRTDQYVVDVLKVGVGGLVSETPPPASVTQQGGRDWSVQAEYFDRADSPVRKHYEVCWASVRRLLTFFKYELRQPNIDFRRAYIRSAEFCDVDGNHVGSPPLHYSVSGFPGYRAPTLGCVVLGQGRDDDLQHAISEGAQVPLAHEILSDAQAAAFDGNIRRSVLELAIACEVAIKTAYFHTDISWAAFEYISNRVQVPLIQFIHGLAKEAFNESFKDIAPSDYANIDHLFRCRNKIAHGGEAYFRDDSGHRHTVDLSLCGSWWDSAHRMLAWLDSKLSTALTH
jgi:hypothetical protein